MTGATGYIGSALVRTLVGKNFDLVALARKPMADRGQEEAIQWRPYDLFDNTDPLSGLENVHCVVHLAGLAHVIQPTAGGLRETFFAANSDASLESFRLTTVPGTSTDGANSSMLA